MIKYDISQGFEKYKNFILRIKDVFADVGETIYRSRNEIKIIDHDGFKLCVKSFGNKNIINRWIYSLLRPSKAKRSYFYAQRLLAKNINTPQPVAYIEYYSNKGILKKSFFISGYFEYDFDLRQTLNFDFKRKLEVFSEFAVYISDLLHKNGVFHKDLSPGNVLIRQKNNRYEFALIDLNRISFRKRISLRKGIINLKRIDSDALNSSVIAYYYALSRGANPDNTVYKLLIRQLFFYFFRRKKQRLKKIVQKIYS